MARLELPAGDLPEIARVWELRPEMGEAGRASLSIAVYQKSQLPARVREGVRMRIAADQRLRRLTGLADPAARGTGRHRGAVRARRASGAITPSTPTPERLAIEYAERFALDHRSIDDAFFARLKEHFTDPEILDLTICIGNLVAFGRLTHAARPRRGVRDAAPRDRLSPVRR